MNMKKSIAGVMAGAMAVSAMAATVSADQDAISLTYDLKTYVNNVNETKAKVTVVANYEGSTISQNSWDVDDDAAKPETLTTGYVTFGADNGYVTGSDIYDKNGAYIGTCGSAAAMKEFEFTARPYKDIPNDLEEKYQTFKATDDAGNTDGAYYDPSKTVGFWDNARSAWISYNMGLGGTYYNMPIAVGNNVYGKFDLTKYDLYDLGYSVAANASAAGVAQVSKSTYAVRDAVAKMTYEVPNTVYLNKANGWGWNASLDVEEADGVTKEFYYDSLYKDVTMSAETFTGGFFKADATKKKVITTSVVKVGDTETKVDTALDSEPTTIAVGAFKEGASAEAVIPFKSTLKPSTSTWTVTNAEGKTEEYVTKENDVIWALQSRKTGGNYYTRPVAVINDAIANHDNVVFTFTSYNGYVGTEKSHLMNQWVNVDQGYTYETSGKGFDWHNPTFGQHLYTNVADGYSLFDSNEYDHYGSYSSAWGINLFTGAVVVNKDLTMQLSDTDTFNWGNNTLSFDWFDIIDEGKITDAKTFLTSMLLYTPVDWYWDSLTVVVSDEEDEAVDAGEGLDGEGEVIDDVEEPEDIEEPEIEEEPEVVETEAAPVETAPSPATGNAPVALAVIPVALAAAAVVAKKRG